MDQWWINGAPGRSLDISDRGLAFGDGLFETIAVRGHQPRFLELHLARLLDGSARLRLPPVDAVALERDLRQRAASITDGVLKLIVTRGPGPRGYALPPRPVPTVAIGLESRAAEPWRPIRARWCETIAGRSPATAGLKTLGRLEQVLARAEWSDDSAEEGLMVGEDGYLVGGTASNVFLVMRGELVTPAITAAGIRGIMRRVIMREALAAELPVVESRVARGDVADAAEIFVSNALTGIRPVAALGAQAWAVGPVTRQLAARLAKAGVGECAGSC
jgi:4-amino-4-deoxychorismate lyase